MTALERRYPRFDGLNLTWETLEGLVKHNGPLTDAGGRPIGRYAAHGLPFAIADYAGAQDLWLSSYAGAEAQAAAIADDIAYDAHDIDDGLRAGLLDLDEPGARRRCRGILPRRSTRNIPASPRDACEPELVRRLITAMIEDVDRREPSAPRGARARLRADDDPPRRPSRWSPSPPAMAAADAAIKAMLYRDVYRHPASSA